MSDFANRVALVVGGSTGIGAATAQMLHTRGATVVVAANDIGRDGASGTSGLQEEFVDVADADSVGALVEKVARQHGRLDHLVNCAGVLAAVPAFEADPLEFKRQNDINYLGSVYAVLKALPIMRAQGGGSIVSISSSTAFLGKPQSSAYAASKAALNRFTSTIAPELAHTGIRINCVAPGATRTAMTAVVHAAETEQARAALAEMERTTASPYGTTFMDPRDIASVVVFLLSDAARAIHGTCVLADQGLSAAMPLG